MNKKEQQNTYLLVGSRIISRVGDIMFDFANNTFLSSVNVKSLMLVGIYQTLENIFSVIFNLFGGVLSDNFQRKRIIILTDILSGVLCLALSFISNQQWLIYAVVITNIILAFFSSFSGPAYKAFTKEVVEADNISKLNSLLESFITVVKVVVPLVSVSLYGLLGLYGILRLDGITFIASGLLILFIRPILEESTGKQVFSLSKIFSDLFEGGRYLASQKEILYLVILSAIVNFFLAAYNLLLPYSNQMFPRVTVGLYGVFLGAEAVGGLIGASLSSILNKVLKIKTMILYLGVSGVFLSLTPMVYCVFPSAYMLALYPALFNLFLTMFNLQFFSYIQKNVDNVFLGRVFGIIFTVAILFMPIGTMTFTFLLSPKNIFNFVIVGLSIGGISLLFYRIFSKRLR